MAETWWNSLNYRERLYDQAFGMIISNADLHSLVEYQGYRTRPRTLANLESSGKSEVAEDAEHFTVKLDVRHFTIGELNIARSGNIIEIKGSHPVKTDAYGTVSREFIRRYLLPQGVALGNVRSTLENGILTIIARKDRVETAPINIDVERVQTGTTESQDVESMDDASPPTAS